MRCSRRLVLLFVPLLFSASAWGQADPQGRANDFAADPLRRIEAFVNARHADLYEQQDSAVRGEFEALLWTFVRDTAAAAPTQLARAYRHLYSLARSDSSYGAQRLRDVVMGLARYGADEPLVAFAEGPVLLAERNGLFAEAEALVLRGMDSLDVQMERDRYWFEDDSLFFALRDEQRSVLVDARGWIRFRSGDEQVAEELLLEAHALWPSNRMNLYRLGRFHENRSDLQRAEHFYRLGALAAAPGENPNRSALRSLYERTRGSLEGWEEYAKAFEESDRALRRDRVLAERLAHPSRLPAFQLEQLGGGVLSSDALLGRIGVINFWGVWCAWCVREMPELQALYEQYRNSDDVRILTINNDTNRDETARWMQEQGYDLPVLWDDGYVAGDAGVTGFPTTWFVDRDGTIVFQQRGWTEQLLEEFSWRIESLRTEEVGNP